MTNASRQSGVSFRQALALLFLPSRRKADADRLAPRMKAALSWPLAATGIACIVVAVAAMLTLAALTSVPAPAETAAVAAQPEVADTAAVAAALDAADRESDAPPRPAPEPLANEIDPAAATAVKDAFWAHKVFGFPFTYAANVLCVVQLAGGLVLLLGARMAKRGRDGSLNRIRKFYVVGYIVPLLGFYVVVEGVNILLLGPLVPMLDEVTGIEKLARAGSVILYGQFFLSNWWIVPIKFGMIFGLLAAGTLQAAAHLLARGDEAAAVYNSARVPRQELGILYAGTGKDRRVRTSYAQSLGVHIVVILVLPWLLIFGAWTSTLPPYVIPGGDGAGGTQEVVKAQIKKQKPKRALHIVANINSEIYIWQPTMDESIVQEKFDENTSVQYTATGGGFGGRGTGKGPPGWKGGGKDGEIRFIRLEHTGRQWDDGMTTEKGRSDQNFLEHIRETTGFKIRTPEAVPIASLKLYKKGQAPPFVFITGQSLSGITTSDQKTLREYCKDGGLIFASSGGGSFDGDFKRLMRDIFPDQPLSDIPNDDLIYREPYGFPDGAPAVQNHGGGSRALGVRAPGTSRLCVFYHPGDIHHAWQSGHGGMKPDVVAAAFKMGMNVIFYAFSNYLDMHIPG